MKKIYYIIATFLFIATSINAQKIAYILPNDCTYSKEDGLDMGSHSELGAIKENPELNAAQWFCDNYVDAGVGEFVNISDIKDESINLSDYETVWIHVERYDMPADHTVGDYGFSEIKKNLADYVVAGGNLYLSKQATFICYDMGRIGYGPNYDRGGYEEKNADDWFCTQPVMGKYNASDITDRSQHAIFVGMTQSANADWWGNALQLCNGRYRLNIRCSWNDFFPRTEEGHRGEWTEGNISRRMTTFEDEDAGWGATVLSVQGNIKDYCMSDIIEFNPCWMLTWNRPEWTEWKGRVITNGSAYYQWTLCDDAPSTGVTTLTSNILKYLAPVTTSVPSFVAPKTCDTLYNLQGQQVTDNYKGIVIKNGLKLFINNN